jgi:hypothetical protein
VCVGFERLEKFPLPKSHCLETIFVFEELDKSVKVVVNGAHPDVFEALKLIAGFAYTVIN